MTVDLNEYYGVTIFHAQKIGPRQWRARARLFRRDTFEVLEEFFADGGAMTSADARALKEAREKVAFRACPPDWRGGTFRS